MEASKVGRKVHVLHLFVLLSQEDDLPQRHCQCGLIGKDVLLKEGLGNLPWGWGSILLLCHAGYGVARMCGWLLLVGVNVFLNLSS